MKKGEKIRKIIVNNYLKRKIVQVGKVTASLKRIASRVESVREMSNIEQRCCWM